MRTMRRRGLAVRGRTGLDLPVACAGHGESCAARHTDCQGSDIDLRLPIEPVSTPLTEDVGTSRLAL